MAKSFFEKNKTLLIILGVVLVIGMIFAGYYNKFIMLDQDIQGQWSEVNNQYQRQADLIPNLISVLSSAVSVETGFVKDVTAARTNYQAATNDYDRDVAGTQMNSGISAVVNAVAENYPVLQANKQYIALMDELAGTQNRITVARGRYIEYILAYNKAVKTFPGNIFANMFGYSEMKYYEAPAGTETPSLGTGQLP
ncbi:MAG: LemA family protein [Candidatus Aenigmarchaeota archaeon]|nr:LemA family protein [Candidatus Aenigmarchaeota archaeon]